MDLSASKAAAEAESAATIESMRPRPTSLPGIRNFRDLGGYETIAGQRVRAGVLYRSANLHKLNAAGRRNLEQLGIHTIIDFRADFEKAKEPDRLPDEPGLQVVNIPILDPSTSAAFNLQEQIKAGRGGSIQPVQLLTKAYVELATRFTPEYQRFVHAVLDAHGRPLLFHCTAGKDRTGFGAAILLRILGVPQEAVLSDYLLSNRYYFEPLRRRLIFIRLLRGRQTAEMVAGFLEARPTYLQTAFGAVDMQYGSFEQYVHRGLELSDEQVAQLQSLYLRGPS